MPVDENGNRADVVMDEASTISRMNIGRLYEQHMNATLRDQTQRVRAFYGFDKFKPAFVKPEELLKKFGLSTLTETHTELLEFYSLFSEKQHSYYATFNTVQSISEHVSSVINEGCKAYIAIDKTMSSKEIVKRIESSKFKPVYGKVKYRGNSGNVVLTNNKVRIAPLYMMLLEKIADDWTAVSTGNLQLFGILSQVNRREKFARPYRNTPVRTIGETEGRLFVGYTGRESIAEMMDRSGNPLVQRHMARGILQATQPTNIDVIVDRNIVTYGNTKPIQLINHMFTSAGFKAKYIKEAK
jgi:RNA polymerase Rpb2, domain 6